MEIFGQESFLTPHIDEQPLGEYANNLVLQYAFEYPVYWIAQKYESDAYAPLSRHANIVFREYLILQHIHTKVSQTLTFFHPPFAYPKLLA